MKRAVFAVIVAANLLIAGCGDALDEQRPGSSAACDEYLQAADAKATEEAEPGTAEHGRLYSEYENSGRFTFDGKTWVEPNAGCATH